MNARCNWIESRLEELTSPEDPASDDRGAGRTVAEHIRSCATCEQELAAYREVDRLLGSYFAALMKAAEMETAETAKTASGAPASPRLPRLVLAAGAAFAALLLVLWIGIGRPTPTGPAVGSIEGAKAAEELEALLAKPSEDEADEARAPDSAGIAPASESLFYVMDRGGYTHTLGDFRGSVLVLGVFDRSGTGREAFGSVYDRIPPGGGIRFLAVGIEAMPAEPVRDILTLVNRGSSLLGLGAGEFAVVTREGRVSRTGSLSDPELEESVKTSLRELGAAVDPQGE